VLSHGFLHAHGEGFPQVDNSVTWFKHIWLLSTVISMIKYSTLTLAQVKIWKRQHSKRHFQSPQKLCKLNYGISSFNSDVSSHRKDDTEHVYFLCVQHLKCKNNEVCTGCFNFMTKRNGSMT
jgi:hypothetical protein